jgi:RNA polymerase-interacting CarD/CdnL/TRCF family regulator
MSIDLHEAVQQFTNEHLIEQYYLEKKQYTEAALEIMKTEINRRMLRQEDIDAVLNAYAVPEADDTYMVKHYDKSEYELIDGAFTTNDALVVRSMLNENSIPLLMDTTAALKTPELPAHPSHPAVLLVHRDFKEQALAIINEHFDCTDMLYSLKFSDTLSRLQSFNFYEVPQAVLASQEITEVDLSASEKDVLITFGNRLIHEADTIESQQERVIFYYDAVEPLIEKLKKPQTPQLTHTDLLTALEILQIYCIDSGFSGEAMNIAEGLLHFFADTASV